MATKTNLEIRRGDTRIYTLTFSIDEEALPLTDYTVYFTVKRYSWLTDENASIVKDITDHFDAVGGISKITLEPTDTEDLDPGIYLYDIQIKKADGAVVTILNGEFEILYDITRRTD